MKLSFISPAQPVACPQFLKSFRAEGLVEARLHITGLGLYRAFVNGQRVGEDWLTPGFNDYTAYLRARSYDILPLLREDNELRVVLGDGWYKGRFSIKDLGPDREIFGSAWLLGVRLVLTHQDRRQTIIDADESWMAGPSEILESSIYDGEVRDDSVQPGPLLPCVRAQPPVQPEPDATPPVRAMHSLRPALITSPKGEHILDFGQNLSGVVRFKNRLPRGKTVRLSHGEVLQEGCFYRDNLRSAKAEYVYTSDGVEKTVEPWFTFYGFRYVLLEGFEAPDPADFEALALYSNLKSSLDIRTDSAKINQLLSNTLWGQRSNFLDVPTDCPQRDERLGWTGDAQVFCSTACYQMDCEDFFHKYLRDLREDQTRYYAGDIPMFSPSLRGIAGAGGPAWADAAAFIPWTLYRHYGSLERLKDHYPLMRDYADKLIRVDLKQGTERLVREGFSFGDWLALDGVSEQSLSGGTDRAFILSMYARQSIQTVALAARELGIPEDGERFQAIADEMREAILDEYFAPSGRLSVDTQTAYALSLAFGVFRNREALKAQLYERLLRDRFILKTGFVGTSLMLPALLDNGMVEEAFKLLYREDYPSWLYAVNLGATTIWERWNSMMPDGSVSDTGMNSFNHYANGSVCEAIYSRIAGLSPLSPGWQRARIAPLVNWRMKRLSMALQTRAGAWRSAWRIGADGSLFVEAEVPEGASAELHLPLHPDGAVKELGPGRHAFTYQTTLDLLRPHSLSSLTEDLLQNEQAAGALEKHLPGFYQGARAGNADFLMMSPEDAMGKLPFLRKADRKALDRALRSITV